jgi:16S rRNA (guanine966-N2)-methyltransferase
MSVRIYGNRELKTLPGLETRPTPVRVRQALFNVWQGTIEGCRWLDLCAGSGAMGAEALCRGASLVVGIERSIPACKIIESNWAKVVGTSQSFRLIQGEVVGQLELLSGQQFDRIYFDPPYGGELYQPVMSAIEKHQLLSPTGELAVEHSPDRAISILPATLPTLALCRQKSYGNTAISFYRTACRLHQQSNLDSVEIDRS